MKRSIRRHHRERLISKRRKYELYHAYSEDRLNNMSGSLANSATSCSCWMCGNPRKYFNHITLRESEALLLYIEGCEESNIYSSLSRNNIPYNS